MRYRAARAIAKISPIRLRAGQETREILPFNVFHESKTKI